MIVIHWSKVTNLRFVAKDFLSCLPGADGEKKTCLINRNAFEIHITVTFDKTRSQQTISVIIILLGCAKTAFVLINC